MGLQNRSIRNIRPGNVTRALSSIGPDRAWIKFIEILKSTGRPGRTGGSCKWPKHLQEESQFPLMISTSAPWRPIQFIKGDFPPHKNLPQLIVTFAVNVQNTFTIFLRSVAKCKNKIFKKHELFINIFLNFSNIIYTYYLN